MSQFIEVIECLDRAPETIVSRFPSQGSAEIKLGAQLVVRESQAAIFFRDGRALDTFGAGRHTLTTLNIPLLTKLLSLPLGGKSPFRTEVYFTNLRSFVNQKWGTMEPILFRDSELDMVRLRAFGIYSFRISNPQVFLNSLVGTVSEFTTEAVAGFFRGLIVTQVASFLGSHLHTVLDLAQHYVEISAGIQARVLADFESTASRSPTSRCSRSRRPTTCGDDRQARRHGRRRLARQVRAVPGGQRAREVGAGRRWRRTGRGRCRRRRGPRARRGDGRRRDARARRERWVRAVSRLQRHRRGRSELLPDLRHAPARGDGELRKLWHRERRGLALLRELRDRA
jgi:hypothetical protein